MASNDLLRSRVHPRFLRSNSTSHKWPFGAIAELCDNACDPDVSATKFEIGYDYVLSSGQTILTFTDDGRGASARTVYKMLSLGYCDKEKYLGGDVKPIGAYGNGFKSGSMRLGDDVLVLSTKNHIHTVGMLSQTYLKAIGAKEVIVPLASWDMRFRELRFGSQEDVDVILKYSPFDTMEALKEQFNFITLTGTHIVVFNLRKQLTPDGQEQLELDFDTDRTDIRLRGLGDGEQYLCTRINQPQTTDNPLDYSLRAYLEVLYLRPRMRIFLRGEKVRTRLLRHCLAHAADDLYKPAGGTEMIITFGVSPVKEFYGMMLYHHNRLIKVCERVGIQLNSDKEGEGIIGIMEADFLEPTHNKQDFNETPQYRKLLQALARKLSSYWELEHMDLGNQELMDTWVQCEDCLKWRNLGVVDSAAQMSDLEEVKWTCQDIGKRCSDPEESEEPRDVRLKKAREQVRKRNQVKKEKTMREKSMAQRVAEAVSLQLKQERGVGQKRKRADSDGSGSESEGEGAGTHRRKRAKRTFNSHDDDRDWEVKSDEERLERLQRVIEAFQPPTVTLKQALTWEFLDTVPLEDWVTRIHEDKRDWEERLYQEWERKHKAKSSSRSSSSSSSTTSASSSSISPMPSISSLTG